MKNELKEIILLEKRNNLRNMSLKHLLKLWATSDCDWLRYKFLKYMRLSNYYNNSIVGIWFLKKKNKYALKLNYEISGKSIGKGITLYHNGPIVIHGKSIIGENLILHGDNCIGNDGITDDCPIIGNNVDVGVGAKIIGGVRIADNVKIGAGAVVVKDIDIQGAVVCGVPARIIKVNE